MFHRSSACELQKQGPVEGEPQCSTVHDAHLRRPVRTAKLNAHRPELIPPLYDADAPERTQPYSQVARRNLVDLCQPATSVRFEPVTTDRYGRAVAHVWCDAVHVNWRQVEDGLAWCFTKYLQAPDTCLPLERAARADRRGLWREAAPVAPWDFRESEKKRDVRQTITTVSGTVTAWRRSGP